MLGEHFSSECITKVSHPKFRTFHSLSCDTEPGEPSLIKSMELKAVFHPVNGAPEFMLQNQLTLHHTILCRPSLQLGLSLRPIACLRETLRLPKILLLSTTPGFHYKTLLSFIFFFPLCTVSLIRKILTPTSTPHMQCLKASQTKIKGKKSVVYKPFLWEFCPDFIIA